MILTADRLLALLPEIYRQRDLERNQALARLLGVIAEQIQVLQEDLAQLYDDQFIETCADWVIPYLGDLVGYNQLHGVTAAVSSPRSEVANTIGLRRRKGTVAMLEGLASDVTGWSSHAVEFFQQLATTQYMNHLRLGMPATPDLRRHDPLERIGTAFDRSAHTANLRAIGYAGGGHNIMNVGIYLWPLRSQGVTRTPAVAVDALRYRFSPLGSDIALVNQPVPLPPDAPLAQPVNVPGPISRRALDSFTGDFYGAGRAIHVEGIDDLGLIVSCDLSDLDAAGTQWAHTLAPGSGRVGIDPVLGRLIFADAPAQAPVVSFHHAFAADLGGGEYDRVATLDTALSPVAAVPLPYATVQDAINAVSACGALEISDGGLYAETLAITLADTARVEIRAATLHRPCLRLGAEFRIMGGVGAELTLNGLLIEGAPLHLLAGAAGAALARLRLVHCTLVPGLSLTPSGAAVTPGAASVIVDTAGTVIELDHCISGPLAVADGGTASITTSIVDAGAATAVAYAGSDSTLAGPPLSVRNSTLIGRVHCAALTLASNTLFVARVNAEVPGWTAPVWADRVQEGCTRFSWLPLESRVPRRHRCLPDGTAANALLAPQFDSLRYGDATYCRLSQRSAQAIRSGADDESEIGVYHDLAEQQRQTNLIVRLAEYLRVGLNGAPLFTR